MSDSIQFSLYKILVPATKHCDWKKDVQWGAFGIRMVVRFSNGFRQNGHHLVKTMACLGRFI